MSSADAANDLPPQPRQASPGASTAPLLRVRNLSMTFPGAKALDGVDFEVAPGEILALCGHNGSGKSTAVKVLAGLYRPDDGSVVEADCDIHFIHQDLGLVPTMTTVENLDLDARRSLRDLLPFRRSEVADARRAIAGFGGRFDVTLPVSRIAPAERTIVAIARATSSWEHTRNVLVLDEPTATLHGDEADRLRTVVRSLAAQGTAIVYISHHLAEVVDLADRALVLRDGKVVMDGRRGDFTEETLLRAVSGDRVIDAGQTDLSPREVGNNALLVTNLTTARIQGLELNVRSGEIVGLSGLIGSGRDEVLGCIFGARPVLVGEILVEGKRIRPGSTPSAITAGLGYVPADRRGLASVPTFNARENLTIASMSGLGGRSLSLAEERRIARAELAAVEVRPLDPELNFTKFSGGNQQKVVIAKWLRMRPKVMLLDEPTQGVDVGARAGIHDLVRSTAAEGSAVLVSSSDEKELVGLCDRVLVMRDGTIAAELVGADITEDNILRAALTSARNEEPGDKQ